MPNSARVELPRVTDNSIWLYQGGNNVNAIKNVRSVEIPVILMAFLMSPGVAPVIAVGIAVYIGFARVN